jgi:hypothetical protein
MAKLTQLSAEHYRNANPYDSVEPKLAQVIAVGNISKQLAVLAESLNHLGADLAELTDALTPILLMREIDEEKQSAHTGSSQSHHAASLEQLYDLVERERGRVRDLLSRIDL